MFMPPVFPAHWHVSQPVLIADTFSSLVWKVFLPDGTPAIVKGLKPIEDIADELRGADYLVWRSGRGAVRLLGRENNLMLLEYAVPNGGTRERPIRGILSTRPRENAARKCYQLGAGGTTKNTVGIQ